jgi:hypothetical protein
VPGAWTDPVVRPKQWKRDMDVQEVGYGGMDWIELAQDRDRRRTLVNGVKNFRVLQNEGNCLTSCKSVSFSRRTVVYGVTKYVNKKVIK